MIAGQTFDNFHDMHQRAVKIARGLEESKKEKLSPGFWETEDGTF